MEEVVRKLEKTTSIEDRRWRACSNKQNFQLHLHYTRLSNVSTCSLRERKESEKKMHMKYENGVLPMIFIIIILYRDGRK